MDGRLDQLLQLLDTDSGTTVNTSVRLPTHLREAAALASEMGLNESITELALTGLRDVLEAFAQSAVLEAHFRAHPEARPDLAEVALAAAELDGNHLAGQPDVIRRAANAVSDLVDRPTADDVLLYAAGLVAPA